MEMRTRAYVLRVTRILGANSAARPLWGAIAPCRGGLPRINARCVVSEWNMEANFSATFDQILPSMKYIFAAFSENYRKFYLREIFEEVNL